MSQKAVFVMTTFLTYGTHDKRSPSPLPAYCNGQYPNHERLLPSTLGNGTPFCPLTTVLADVANIIPSILVHFSSVALLHASPLLDYTIITVDTGVVKEKICSSDTSEA